jgi:hypothetical protein
MGEIMKVTRKIAKIESNLFNTIYKYLELTIPLHKLDKSQIKLLTIMLYQYHNSKELDDIDKWAEIFSYVNKLKIREKLGDMSAGGFNNHLSQLRKKKVIKNNRVNPLFNPAIEKDSDTFEVIIRFNIKK